ncbi:MAG: hypothetical protein KTR25_12120 [Myxococcales bacterium]|nr:hypothetical protein [Myxococcales bacterium]
MEWVVTPERRFAVQMVVRIPPGTREERRCTSSLALQTRNSAWARQTQRATIMSLSQERGRSQRYRSGSAFWYDAMDCLLRTRESVCPLLLTKAKSPTDAKHQPVGSKFPPRGLSAVGTATVRDPSYTCDVHSLQVDCGKLCGPKSNISLFV